MSLAYANDLPHRNQMAPDPYPALRFRRRLVVMPLAAAILALSVIHLGTQWLRYHTGITGIFGITDLFALQQEGNVPAFFASLQLLLAAALLAWTALIMSHRGDRFSLHWRGLSLVFLLLSIDESCSIHELMIIPLHDLLDGAASGLLYWPWVLPGMAFVLALAVLYFRWFIALDPRSMRLFAVSAIVFLSGAIGVEMFEARHVEINDTDNFGYAFYVWFEETFELVGVLVFIHGLLCNLERIGSRIEASVVGAPEPPRSESA